MKCEACGHIQSKMVFRTERKRMKKVLAVKLCGLMGWNIDEAFDIQNRSLTQKKLSDICGKLAMEKTEGAR